MILQQLEKRKKLLSYLNSPSNEEVYTPIALVEEMLDKLPKEIWKNPDLTWCDPCAKSGVFILEMIIQLMKNLEIGDETFTYNHIINNMVKAYVNVERNKWLVSKIVYGSIKEVDKIEVLEIDKIKEENNMKFDVVCGNPPYKQGMHLKFLKMSTDICKKEGHIIFIQPAQWLVVEGKNNYTNVEKELVNVFNNNETYIKLLNGRKYFNIALGLLSINYIKLNNLNSIIIDDEVYTNTQYNIKNIKEISKFGVNILYKNLKLKILNNVSKHNILNFLNKNNGNFIVNVPRVRGHIDEINFNKIYVDDFYTLLSKKYIKPDNCIDEKKKRWFSFKTEKEAINFINYLKTYYVRFCLAIRKNNIATFQTSECNLIPWLDFSQEWTDEKLYKYFNLTQEEIKFIEKNIPKYYE